MCYEVVCVGFWVCVGMRCGIVVAVGMLCDLRAFVVVCGLLLVFSAKLGLIVWLACQFWFRMLSCTLTINTTLFICVYVNVCFGVFTCGLCLWVCDVVGCFCELLIGGWG